MTTLLVSFCVSFAGIIVLVSLKLGEMKGFDTRVLGWLRQKFDHKFLTLYRICRNFIMFFNVKNLERLAIFLFREFVSLVIKIARFFKFGEMVKELSAFSLKFKDMVRGKRFLKNHGAVSFFLRDVAENKKREGYRI